MPAMIFIDIKWQFKIITLEKDLEFGDFMLLANEHVYIFDNKLSKTCWYIQTQPNEPNENTCLD